MAVILVGGGISGLGGLEKSDSFQTPQNNLAVIPFHTYQEHNKKIINWRLL